MPYRTSSPESLAHAQLVVDALGIRETDRGHQRGRGRSRGGAARAADARPPGQHHGPHPHDHAVRPERGRAGAAAGHGQQDRAAVRLLHLARGRLAAGEPDRRPVQDPGLGAGPPPRRARRDRLQAGERRPHHGTDRRGRLRHQLSAGRRDPPLDPAGLPRARDRGARLQRGRRSPWSARGWTPPTGSAGSPRSPC